ncbi:MAG: hypothetical protein PGMFKBFP_02196 [Anaerolineales bacterium]|nr:hypothetical protein [Anaerolineales bacterium]
MRVDVDPSRQRGAHVFDRRGVADPRGVIVDKVSLKFLHLLVVQDLFRKLADAGVRAVHDLFRGQFLFQHGAAGFDPLQRGGGQFHFFVPARDGDNFFDGEG